MIRHIAESHVEDASLAWLRELGYAVTNGLEIAPDSPTSERESYSDVVLIGRLKKAIARLNPSLPAEAHADALRRVLQTEKPSPTEENRRLHKAIVEGVDIEYFGEDGVI